VVDLGWVQPRTKVGVLGFEAHGAFLKRPDIDVAFRFGSLPDSSATARKVIDAPRILAAAPFYFEKQGTPLMPSDLAHHAVIIGPTNDSPTFSFRKDGRVASVRVESRLAVTINEGAIAGEKAVPSFASCPTGTSARWKSMHCS
jgi:hypothetical protein